MGTVDLVVGMLTASWKSQQKRGEQAGDGTVQPSCGGVSGKLSCKLLGDQEGE